MKTPEQWADYVVHNGGSRSTAINTFTQAIKEYNDRETILRSTLLEFVRVERSFGHNGQHKDSECADCKRVNMANNALSHGELNQ